MMRISSEGIQFFDVYMNPTAVDMLENQPITVIGFSQLVRWQSNALDGTASLVISLWRSDATSNFCCVKLTSIVVGDAHRLCGDLDYWTEKRRWKVTLNRTDHWVGSDVELEVAAGAVSFFDGDIKIKEIR